MKFCLFILKFFIIFIRIPRIVIIKNKNKLIIKDGKSGVEHDYGAAWKTILEAFEEEIVELLFPKIYHKINWSIKSEALDNELLEIQKEIFDKKRAEKIISHKIIKVKMKDNESKILFSHVEVQSYHSNENIFAERMFRYFYRIWDKFKYKNKDNSDIVGAVIYTYKGLEGKDEIYIFFNRR